MPTVKRVRPEHDIVRPIQVAVLWRYYVVSCCHVVLIMLATVCALTIAVALVFDPPLLSGVKQQTTPLMLLFVSTGGLGSYLLRVDQRERAEVRYHQALDLLIQMPDGKEKEKAIYELVKKLTPPKP